MKKIIIYLFVSLVLWGCKKDENTNNLTSNYFLNATINGQDYTRNEVNFFGVTNRIGCVSGKYYTSSNISQISSSSYFLNVFLKHYSNDADYRGTSSGSYAIIENDILIPDANSCNMDLLISLRDLSFPPGSSAQDCTFVPNSSTNNITSINLLSQNSTDVTYNIEGNFTCKFKNSANAVIEVSGNYKTFIKALK